MKFGLLASKHFSINVEILKLPHILQVLEKDEKMDNQEEPMETSGGLPPNPVDDAVPCDSPDHEVPEITGLELPTPPPHEHILDESQREAPVEISPDPNAGRGSIVKDPPPAPSTTGFPPSSQVNMEAQKGLRKVHDQKKKKKTTPKAKAKASPKGKKTKKTPKKKGQKDAAVKNLDASFQEVADTNGPSGSQPVRTPPSKSPFVKSPKVVATPKAKRMAGRGKGVAASKRKDYAVASLAKLKEVAIPDLFIPYKGFQKLFL